MYSYYIKCLCLWLWIS